MYIIAAVLSQLFARGSAMKNNDGFFGNGCGFIIVAPLLACICIAVGCWGYNRYGIPEIYGSLLFLVAFFLLNWCANKLADKPIKALQRRANERTRRDSLLRQGICPECEVPLEMISFTSSLGETFYEEPRSYQEDYGRHVRYYPHLIEANRQKVHHVKQYRCSSCKQEFTRRYTSDYVI